jgi:DNA repair protein RecO (recombination protein O)
MDPVSPVAYHVGMALSADQAIVLRRLDYSETSQVLVFFGRARGKIRAIAKGIKRSTRSRFAAAIDLLDVGHLVYSTRSARQAELAILTEWTQSEAFIGLRGRLQRLYAAQYAAEVVAGLTEDWDPHPALYDGLLSLLSALSDADAVLDPVVSFQRTLLLEIGSFPELEACVGCGRVVGEVEPLWFSSFEGGLLCRDCEAAHAEKRAVAPGALPALRGDASAGAPVAAAFDLYNYHTAHLMGRNPLLAPWVRVLR